MLPLVGSLIGAGTNLLGGLLGQSNQASINAANIGMQEQINQQNIANQDMLNAQNIAEQEKFAQSGIQWRVADAKAAGISPLAALGAQTSSFANNVGTTATAPQAQASNSFGTGIAAAGQDISRAIAATRSPEEQAVAIEKTRQDLEAGQLDNDLKKAQLSSAVTRLKSAQVGPGIPKSTAVVTRNADGSFTSGPGKEAEGWSWSNPMAKPQWLIGQEAPQWFGSNIPPAVERQAPGHMARNPFTGNYYQMPWNADDASRAVGRGWKSLRETMGSPWFSPYSGF